MIRRIIIVLSVIMAFTVNAQSVSELEKAMTIYQSQGYAPLGTYMKSLAKTYQFNKRSDYEGATQYIKTSKSNPPAGNGLGFFLNPDDRTIRAFVESYSPQKMRRWEKQLLQGDYRVHNSEYAEFESPGMISTGKAYVNKKKGRRAILLTTFNNQYRLVVY